MKRATAFLLILMIACFIIGCGSSDLTAGDPDPVAVGAYKGPWGDWDYLQYTKGMGHANHDTRNPTVEEAKQYCSICHYIY